jgi:predicted GIY-YIG superfamily endonuclease
LKQVYLLKSDYTGYYKIGVSKNTSKRVKQLETGSSEDISIIFTFTSEMPYKLENALHNFYNQYKVNREWYNLSLENELEFSELCERTERNLKLVFGNSENYS